MRARPIGPSRPGLDKEEKDRQLASLVHRLQWLQTPGCRPRRVHQKKRRQDASAPAPVRQRQPGRATPAILRALRDRVGTRPAERPSQGAAPRRPARSGPLSSRARRQRHLDAAQRGCWQGGPAFRRERTPTARNSRAYPPLELGAAKTSANRASAAAGGRARPATVLGGAGCGHRRESVVS